MSSPTPGEPPAPSRWQRSKKVRRAWSTYRWFDRLRNWQDWYQWLVHFFGSKAGTAVALGSVAAVTTTAAVVVHDVAQDRSPPVPIVVAAPPPEPTPVVAATEPEPVRQTASTLIFAIEGKDKEGRAATFDVVVAKKEFLWVRGSSDELERNGVKIAGAAVAEAVIDDDIKAGLENAREVVAVGTASQEGNAAEERERARKRAERTAALVAGSIDAAIPISTLNLGQYRETCRDCDRSATNWQRPFMVIAVKEVADGTVLSEALADALTGKEKLPSPSSYSTFDLARYR